MSLFTRKPRLAHQIIGEKIHVEVFNRDEIQYRCTVCNLTFSSAIEANENQCKGKSCYPCYLSRYPIYLMTKDEIEATNRTLRPGQEPAAYAYNDITEKPARFWQLYDVRKAITLENAVPLPDFEEQS